MERSARKSPTRGFGLLGGLALAILCFTDPAVRAEEYFVEVPDGGGILRFSEPLGLTVTDADNQGLTVDERRLEIDLVDADVNPLSFDSTKSFYTKIDEGSLDLNLGLNGSPDRFRFEYLNEATTLNAVTQFGTGTDNQPLILDLGEFDLTVSGENLESQGAIYVTTVNSEASANGLVMNGVDGLSIDASTTGQVIAGELIEQTSGTPGNFSILADLNSTLQDGANFIFASETNAQIVDGEAANIFGYDVPDTENSRLFDNSYVINSRATREIDDTTKNESVRITFSRADNEYIEKSFTRNHPSNDAALKLGRIAADGVALGDMQTALTRLDINDFGYGDTAENLAVEVKRLAPLANNAMFIAARQSMGLVQGAMDYRFGARRGNWSAHSDEPATFYLMAHGGQVESSGSVPVSNADSQDTAGHDGFSSVVHGMTVGADRRFRNGLIGFSLSEFDSTLTQADDRNKEEQTQKSQIGTLYARLNSRYWFANLSASHSSGDTEGVRKSALDRVARFTAPFTMDEGMLTLGRRFDLSDGRTAISPFYRVVYGEYRQDNYQETDAGALSLNVAEHNVAYLSQSLGLQFSHKDRYFGRRSLLVASMEAGDDRMLDSLDVVARYSGDTHTAHPDYTTFVTPAERWASVFVGLDLDMQVEIADGVMFNLNGAFEHRNSRQDISGGVNLIWVF